MATVIRMQRAGSRNHPTYRVVVTDSRNRRDGRFIEKVGFYNPCSTPVMLDIDAERVKFWMERGAQPSESVAALLKRQQAGTLGELSPSKAGAAE
ncbi:MAG: 30S ribosomal protein S16 [Candidatus Eisenbacteria bacterium]|uniref:Small ribosomal subunit protein bS16 n=1 Tax=Eiseniibacteriota bacterium TaxID=2212470 RepID=A0A956LW19_UNCEI|nr:30S ribosomal protein S16 [Candidatus Eisenbacteria bacterium]